MTQLSPAANGEIRLALFQPDIAPNVGAIIRTCACLSVPLDVIEPCGFPFSLHAVRRQAMDYGDRADITRHDSWDRFQDGRAGRLVAMTTHGSVPLWDFTFETGDILLMGRESAGLPDEVHRAADARVAIPMAAGTRSLNIAVAAGIVMAEGLRQLGAGRAP
ncbi:MAG: tRNA (cytidine(34)-2'-O)-methyltransferase [Pseudomonadota bacterium]